MSAHLLETLCSKKMPIEPANNAYNDSVDRTVSEPELKSSSAPTSYGDLDLGQCVGSPMVIRTDLSLEQSLVSSPLVLPMPCPNYPGQVFEEVLQTPCPNIASPSSEAALEELTPVIPVESQRSQTNQDMLSTLCPNVTSSSAEVHNQRSQTNQDMISTLCPNVTSSSAEVTLGEVTSAIAVHNQRSQTNQDMISTLCPNVRSSLLGELTSALVVHNHRPQTNQSMISALCHNVTSSSAEDTLEELTPTIHNHRSQPPCQNVTPSSAEVRLGELLPLISAESHRCQTNQDIIHTVCSNATSSSVITLRELRPVIPVVSHSSQTNQDVVCTLCPNATSSSSGVTSVDCPQSGVEFSEMQRPNIIATEIVTPTANSITMATVDLLEGLSPVSNDSDNTVIQLRETRPDCNVSQISFNKQNVTNSGNIPVINITSDHIDTMQAIRSKEANTQNSRQLQGDVTSKNGGSNKAPKKRRKRQRPDPNEPPLSPPITVLPPCAVCGNKSSGFHYGANTCEACKGFFRRTLKKNEVKFQCVCTEEENQGNGVGKSTCPACRYQRCLDVGMSRNAIKIGRYSLQRKTKNICHVKTLETEGGKSDEKSPRDCTETVTSPSNSSNSSASFSNSPKDCETMIGSSKDAPPAKKSRFSGDITLKEIDTFVKTLYHAYKLLEEPQGPVTEAEALRRQQAYFEQYKLKREMFGLEKPISKADYFELYHSTGIELDNRKEHLMEAVKYFEKVISRLVEFAKCIPGFRELCLEDQANLIKAARMDCSLLPVNFQFYNRDLNIATTPWGKHIHVDEADAFVNKEFLFEKLKAREKVENLDLSHEEEAILTGIILTYTDRCELTEPEKVQSIQHKLLTCLEYLINIRPTNKPGKIYKVFNFLTQVRNVSEWEAQIIKEICLDWPSVINEEELESRVIYGLEDSNTLVNPQDFADGSS